MTSPPYGFLVVECYTRNTKKGINGDVRTLEKTANQIGSWRSLDAFLTWPVAKL